MAIYKYRCYLDKAKKINICVSGLSTGHIVCPQPNSSKNCCNISNKFDLILTPHFSFLVENVKFNLKIVQKTNKLIKEG